MSRPIRVLISKIGLDGHDRGAKLIVRHLRDAGMDVIYTGLWQTPAATVQAAIHEDVDILGVSLLSAAHLTVMPEVVRLCREAGAGDMPVIVGGIIPQQDHAKLREMGLAAIFNPGTSLEEITRTFHEIADARRARLDAAKAPLDITRPIDLGRAITHIAAGHKDALAALLPPGVSAAIIERLPPAGAGQTKATAPVKVRTADSTGATGAIARAGSSAAPAKPGTRRSITIGVTGAPGVGKSTFIGKLARALRRRGRRVAVIAVDPTSPLTGGSVLGDRLRMMSPEPDDGLFIRSLSSGNQAGGLAPYCGDIARLLAAAGFDVVLVETVGAGQGDTDVRNVADEIFVLLMPGSGDAVQFFKAGIMEIATGFVVNKADLPGADLTIKELSDSMEDKRPVWPVSALRDEGFEPLCEWIEQR